MIRFILPINTKMTEIRCALCKWTGDFERDILPKNVDRCPNCGTLQKPLATKEDVVLKINWQDLRLLCIYAQRFVATFSDKIPANRVFKEMLERIVKHVEASKPIGSANLNPHLSDPKVARDIDLRKQSDLIPSPYITNLINRNDDDSQQ